MRNGTGIVAAVALAVSLGGLLVEARPARADDAFARITVGGILIPGDQPAINGITGSANAIQVFATTFGLSNPPTSPGFSPPGIGTLKPVGIVKHVDRSSPTLLRLGILGSLMTVEVVWYMDINGVAKQTATLRLENAYISNLDASAQLSRSDAATLEEVTFVYGRIRLTVPSGTATVTTCWDVALQKPC